MDAVQLPVYFLQGARMLCMPSPSTERIAVVLFDLALSGAISDTQDHSGLPGGCSASQLEVNTSVALLVNFSIPPLLAKSLCWSLALTMPQ